MLEIVPSLASANQACLKDEIERLGEGTVKNLHLDIEDGNFIPNITFGIKTLRDLRKVTDLPFSVHLMANNPEKYLPELKEIGKCSVSFHIEACQYPRDIINLAKDLNLEVGLALNPKTPLNGIEYLIEDLNFFLIMTSEPDRRGQTFISQTLQKVSELSKMKTKQQKIWVDGGITENLLYDVWKAGADVVVMGRAIFGDENPKEKIEKMKRVIENFIGKGEPL